ncbi:histone H1.1-like [Erythrolamprus reginae]|uniref:histone H1.1-like n=1 Tax=Erythrolamprus reginae TaxID=121349 RepID=UPI00396CCC91
MELNKSHEVIVLDDSSSDLTDDEDESSGMEDVEEVPGSDNISDSSGSSAPQDPLLGGSNSSNSAGGRSKKSKAADPSISMLIYTALVNSQKKFGLTLKALKNVVENMGYDTARKKSYFLKLLRSLLAKGQLIQLKANRYTRSFKINPDYVKSLPVIKKNNPKNKRLRNKKRAAKSKARKTAKK